jgi:hypothetical protein
MLSPMALLRANIANIGYIHSVLGISNLRKSLNKLNKTFYIFYPEELGLFRVAYNPKENLYVQLENQL